MLHASAIIKWADIQHFGEGGEPHMWGRQGREELSILRGGFDNALETMATQFASTFH